MKKKGFAILLVLVMVFAVVGCGGGSEPATSDPSSEPIRLGNWTYLSGSNAQLGKFIENGFRLAVKHINERGGIQGRPVEPIVYDQEGLPEKTLQVVKRMIEQDKVTAIVGACTTPALLSIMETVEKEGILNTYCGTSATATNLGNKFTFRVMGGAYQMDTTTFSTMQEMGMTKLGMLAINNEYGTQGVAEFEEWCADAGIEFMHDYYAQADADLTVQLSKFYSAGCDTYLMYCNNGTDMCNAFKTLRRLGWTDYIWGTESCSSTEFRDITGADANGGIYATTTVIPDSIEEAVNEQEKQFLTDYVEEYGDLPASDVSYRAYDAAMLLALALENSDLNDPESMSEAFFSIKGYEGIQGTFDFTDRSGDGLQVTGVFVINEGKNIPLSRWTETHDITKPFGEG